MRLVKTSFVPPQKRRGNTLTNEEPGCRAQFLSPRCEKPGGYEIALELTQAQMVALCVGSSAVLGRQIKVNEGYPFREK